MRRVGMKICALMVTAVILGGCARSPEARRDRYVARGKQLLQKQDYGRALLEFRNAAQAKPDDAEVYYQMGLAFNAMGDIRAAYQAFGKAVALQPKHREAQLKIAQIQVASGDEDLAKEAQGRLKAFLAEGNGTAEMLNTLAFSELRLGDTESAIQNFERALAQSPGELLATVMLAQASYSRKDFKGAEDILKKACADVPKSADVRRILGEFYQVRNRAADAEAEFRRALAINPKSGPALLDLARLELADGRKQEAEQSFKQLSSLDGYQSAYATFLYQQERRDEAIRELERLVKADPENRAIRTDLVVAYRMANRTADADQVLAKALKKNPGDVDALLQRGEIALERADYAQAETDLNRVLKLKPTAPEAHYVFGRLNLARGMPLIYRQEISEALRLNPELIPVRAELAQHLVNAKEARAAIALLDEAPASQRSAIPLLVQRNWALWVLGDLPEMRKGIDQGLAIERSPELLVQDGLWKLRAGDPARARASLEEALKINPSDLRALEAITQTYIAQKNSSMALQKVKEYAASHPNSAPIHDFLGTLLVANGNRVEARTAFTTAHATDPGLLNAEMSLIQLDVGEGKLDEARRRLEGVLAKQSGNLTARLWLGNVEVMMGNQTGAIEHFRNVVSGNPVDAQALNNLAYLLAEANQTDEALKYAEKAVELVPTKAAYCDTLGWVLYKKGLYTSAIPYFERASADPGSVVWKYHLAMAYAKAGDMKRGRAMLTDALKRNAKVPEAKAAQELIAGTE
jgi:tetratricopeptide (TPR) repeat protein